jgi:hypothetical protein
MHVALLEELDCMPTHLLQQFYAQGDATLLGAAGSGDDADDDCDASPGQGDAPANGHAGTLGLGGIGSAGGASSGASNGVGGAGGGKSGKSGAEQADMPSAAQTVARIYAAQIGRYIAADEQPMGGSSGLSAHLRSALGHSQGMAAAITVSAAVSPEALSCYSRRAPCRIFCNACAPLHHADGARSPAVLRCSSARAACQSSRCCGSARARKTWHCR